MTAPAPHVPRRSLLRGLAAGGAGALGLVLLGGARPAAALGGTLPELDQPAPDFQLPGIAAGEPVSLGLADFRGRWVVLYFYPRDFTSGCTLEARGFQRDRQAFVAAGAEVVGVSADGEEEHASFCQSEGLGYPLLSDPDGRVSRAYGSWISPFSQRHTFLIDPQGVLRARWVAVRPASHSQEVLTALRELQGSSAG
ncbi:MAG: peroxiredoxin [Synechococcus sp.]|nr:peroxiredoxin [Synechococcus sp.]